MSIEIARKTIKDFYNSDEGLGFKVVYTSRIAMLLRNELGTLKNDECNTLAEKILNVIFN